MLPFRALAAIAIRLLCFVPDIAVRPSDHHPGK